MPIFDEFNASFSYTNQNSSYAIFPV